MNKLITILAITATLIVIVFTTLDRRDGLWHKTNTDTTEIADSAAITTDTTASESSIIEIEPLVDTTIINI